MIESSHKQNFVETWVLAVALQKASNETTFAELF